MPIQIHKCDEKTSLSTASAFASKPGVLIFDSGVGGLSICKEVRQWLPELNYVYVFDNEAFPYGNKSEAFIIKRVLNIITAITQQWRPSLLILACNSASTITLPTLRSHFDFPVVGVVPAIKPAARLTRNGIVGLLATCGTVQRPYTHQLVERFASRCRTEMLGSSELVEYAEMKLRGEPVVLNDIRRILKPWLRMSEPPDTIVLGCTHFPLLRSELVSVLPYGTQLVDSGAAIARRVAWLIRNEVSEALTEKNGSAFCTVFNQQTTQFYPVLNEYGFNKLEKLAF